MRYIRREKKPATDRYFKLTEFQFHKPRDVPPRYVFYLDGSFLRQSMLVGSWDEIYSDNRCIMERVNVRHGIVYYYMKSR